MRIPVVFACDDAYVMPLSVAVTSMLYNKRTTTGYDIWILYSDLSERSKARLRELEVTGCCIQLLNVTEYTYNIQKAYQEKNKFNKGVTKETMYRFWIPQILESLEKVLYLDCDMLIQGDLEELYSYDMKDSYACVVKDIDVAKRIKGLDKEVTCYFNAGMLLMNLKKMREDNVPEKLQALFWKSQGYVMMDQDILNIVIGDKVVYLSEKYNFLSEAFVNGGIDGIRENYYAMNLKSVEEYLEKIVILHYAGEKKPWLYQLPYITDIFMRYYKMTSYKKYHLMLMPGTMDYPVKSYTDRNYMFPDFDIPRGSQIILYGAGELGKAYFQQIMALRKYKLIHWIDSKAENYQLQGLPVGAPQEIMNYDFDYIIIGVKGEKVADEIITMLTRMGIAQEKIRWKNLDRILSTFQEMILQYKATLR